MTIFTAEFAGSNGHDAEIFLLFLRILDAGSLVGAELFGVHIAGLPLVPRFQ